MRRGLLTQQNQRRWASYRVAEGHPQSPGDSPQSAEDVPKSLMVVLPLAMPALMKKKLQAQEAVSA